MTLLIADVGGTNTRVALARSGIPTAVAHYVNAEHDSLAAVLRDYLGARSVTACAIALAGPVAGEEGRLTNWPWRIEAAEMARATGAARVTLLNDLSALGYALAPMPETAIRVLRQAPYGYRGNGQALVIGLGTGFNVCPVIAEGPRCLVVEAGQTALPAAVAEALPEGAGFRIAEDLFSGAGLAALHAARHPGAELSGREIVAAERPETAETLMLFVKLLGHYCAELTWRYMPLDGVYFAGSVARGVLTPDLVPRLFAPHADHGKVGNPFAALPVSLILDDAAALHGCIAAAKR